MFSPIVMLNHTHKEYAFNFDSSWVKASYAGSTAPFEWHPPSDKGAYINVYSGGNTIKKYRHYYNEADEIEFLKAIGQQATDYYLANNDFDADYLGVGSYRRYLAINEGVGFVGEKIHVPSTNDFCKILTSNSQMQKALNYFKSVDVICSRYRMMNRSIENQYLQSQLPEYWNLFKEGIQKINPEYRRHMLWFTDYSICNYECVYIMRKDIFKRLVSEYFEIMEYIWKNCSETFPNKANKQYTCTEIYPWRYPGFLNERFVPFFIYANNLRKIEVPLAFLE